MSVNFLSIKVSFNKMCSEATSFLSKSFNEIEQKVDKVWKNVKHTSPKNLIIVSVALSLVSPLFSLKILYISIPLLLGALYLQHKQDEVDKEINDRKIREAFAKVW